MGCRERGGRRPVVIDVGARHTGRQCASDGRASDAWQAHACNAHCAAVLISAQQAPTGKSGGRCSSVAACTAHQTTAHAQRGTAHRQVGQQALQRGGVLRHHRHSLGRAQDEGELFGRDGQRAAHGVDGARRHDALQGVAEKRGGQDEGEILCGVEMECVPLMASMAPAAMTPCAWWGRGLVGWRKAGLGAAAGQHARRRCPPPPCFDPPPIRALAAAQQPTWSAITQRPLDSENSATLRRWIR